MMIFSAPLNVLSYTALGVIGIEIILFWTLIFSEPGIPQKILENASKLSAREPIESSQSSDNEEVNSVPPINNDEVAGNTLNNQ